MRAMTMLVTAAPMIRANSQFSRFSTRSMSDLRDVKRSATASSKALVGSGLRGGGWAVVGAGGEPPKHPPLLSAKLVECLGDGAGDAVGCFSGEGALIAEEAGDGAGAGEGQGGESGIIYRGHGRIAMRPYIDVLGAEEGQDAAEGDAGGGDFIVEGQVIGAGDEVGELLGEQRRGVESMGAAVLVAAWGSGAGVAAGVGGAAGRITVTDGPGLAGAASGVVSAAARR
jgi:hypothetical protein